MLGLKSTIWQHNHNKTKQGKTNTACIFNRIYISHFAEIVIQTATINLNGTWDIWIKFYMSYFQTDLVIDSWGISREVALRWMSMELSNEKSTLFQVTAWCRQATSRCLSQYSRRSISLYGVSRPQWVNTLKLAWNGPHSLPWRHNGLDSVSNHQHHHCLLSRLFGRRSKKTSKLRVTGLCAWNSPGTGEFPAQRASYAENVSIWWRHHVAGDVLQYISFIISILYNNSLPDPIAPYWYKTLNSSLSPNMLNQVCYHTTCYWESFSLMTILVWL